MKNPSLNFFVLIATSFAVCYFLHQYIFSCDCQKQVAAAVAAVEHEYLQVVKELSKRCGCADDVKREIKKLKVEKP